MEEREEEEEEGGKVKPFNIGEEDGKLRLSPELKMRRNQFKKQRDQ